MPTRIVTATLSLSLLALSACAAGDPGIESSPDGEDLEEFEGPEAVYIEEAVVGPEGGLIEATFGTTIVVPPGALAQDTALTIEMTPSYVCGFELSDRYELGPAETTFAQPVTVMLLIPSLLEDPCVMTEGVLGTPDRELDAARVGDFMVIALDRFDGEPLLVMSQSMADGAR